MSKTKLLMMLSSCIIIAATAQETKNLLPAGDGENIAVLGKNWQGFIQITDTDKKSGQGAILIDRVAMIRNKTLIPIDSSKTYVISGWLKSKNPEQLSRGLLDVRYYTADKKAIKPRSVQPASSVSELVKATGKGATELLVKRNKWPRAPRGILAIVFNAKDDLSDLPNFELGRIKKYSYSREGYKITLSKPLTKDYPAGCKVRLHRYLDYPRVGSNSISADKWTNMNFTIGSGAPKKYKIWPGAKYMQIALLNQYKGYPKPLPKDAKPPQLLIDDLSVTELIKEDAVK